MFEKLLHPNSNSKNPIITRKYLSPSILLGFILLLGIGLRLYDIGAESYWIDEMSTVIEGQQSIRELFSSGRLDQPPAYYLPFIYWVQTFGAHEVSTRLFSALIGMGSIVLIFIIGRELFGNEVGLLAAFFMAISEYQIYYSQVARFYILFEFLSLLSFLFFVIAIRSGKVLHFAMYILASILLVYSHTYGIFVLAAQNIFVLLQWKKYRSMIILWFFCQVLIILAFVPYFYPRLFSEGSLEGTIDSNVGQDPVSFLDPLRSIYRFIFSSRRGRSWGPILANYAVAGVVFVVGIWIYIRRQGNRKMIAAMRELCASLREVLINSKGLLLGCWLASPIALPFLVSLVIFPIYKAYYTISAAPALYLLLALILFHVRKVVPLIISIGMYAIMVLPGLGYYYTTDIHEQWKEAAVYIEENSESSSDEVIVFAPNMGVGIQEKSFKWYYRGNLHTCGLSSELIDIIAISEAITKCTSGYEQFWVIIPDYPNITSDDRYQAYFLSPPRSNMQMIKQQQFVGVSVYLFIIIE